jgi:hypothetical protein
MSESSLTKLMLKVIRDTKMMPNDIMCNGKTVARNSFEHVRGVLQRDLEINVIKTKRRQQQTKKTDKTAEENADTV